MPEYLSLEQVRERLRERAGDDLRAFAKVKGFDFMPAYDFLTHGAGKPSEGLQRALGVSFQELYEVAPKIVHPTPKERAAQ